MCSPKDRCLLHCWCCIHTPNSQERRRDYFRLPLQGRPSMMQPIAVSVQFLTALQHNVLLLCCRSAVHWFNVQSKPPVDTQTPMMDPAQYSLELIANKERYPYAEHAVIFKHPDQGDPYSAKKPAGTCTQRKITCNAIISNNQNEKHSRTVIRAPFVHSSDDLVSIVMQSDSGIIM